jgi:hypothetical protein
MTTTLTKTQIEALFASFGDTCEKLLANITPESELQTQGAQAAKNKVLVSNPLHAAIKEIIAACKKGECHLAHKLLGVKSLICSAKIRGEAFWEKGNGTGISLYTTLDSMEFEASMALNKIPRGIVCVTSCGMVSAEDPTDPLESPTLKLIIETFERNKKEAYARA